MKTVIGLLRIGIFGTFLGHGILAIMVNPNWIPFLEFWGINRHAIGIIMPVIGLIDLVVALITLIRPSKYVLIYAAVWAFLTALVRPITGQSWLMFVERSANWAAPAALYFMLHYTGNKPAEN